MTFVLACPMWFPWPFEHTALCPKLFPLLYLQRWIVHNISTWLWSLVAGIQLTLSWDPEMSSFVLCFCPFPPLFVYLFITFSTRLGSLRARAESVLFTPLSAFSKMTQSIHLINSCWVKKCMNRKSSMIQFYQIQDGEMDFWLVSVLNILSGVNRAIKTTALFQ